MIRTTHTELALDAETSSRKQTIREGNIMKKVLVGAATAVAVLMGFAGSASAHTPIVSASCRVLTVDLKQYDGTSTVTLTVDDETAVYTFNGDWYKAIPWSPEKAHVVSVQIDNRSDGMGKDQWDAVIPATSTPCVTPTTVVTTTIPIVPLATVPVVNPPVIISTPAVLEKAPVADDTPQVKLAFTGSHAQNRAEVAAVLLAVGIACLFIGRRFGKKLV